jgi:uncharacterized membrane protein
MLTTLRRFLFIQALLLWQGGFVFYAAVVVPIGTEVLGSATAQGIITQRVTWWLNLFGLICLTLLAWDTAVTRDPFSRRQAARWWLWIAAIVLLYLLWFFHQLLGFYLDPRGEFVQMKKSFQVVHILYLWASTLHWLIGLALAWLTLTAWQAEDRDTGRNCEP